MNLKLIGSTALLLILFSCRENKPKSDSDIPVLPVVYPKLKDTIVEERYTVNIQAKKNVEIRSRLRSILEKTYIDEGAAVVKGQELFKLNSQELEIESTQAEAALKQAEADAESAKVDLIRVKELVESKVVTRSDLAIAKAKYQAMDAKVLQMKAILKNADNRVGYSILKAPFTGVIDRLPLKTGSLIDEGSLLTNLSDLTEVYAYFEIPESEYISHIKEQNSGNKIWLDTANLLLSDGSVYPSPGIIQNSESIIDPNTGSIAFRVKFENPYKILRHNSSGTIILHKELHNVLYIPLRAVYAIQDKNYVFVVNNKNIVHLKEFKAGARIGNLMTIVSGLDITDQIVYEGIQNLKEGMKINIRKG